MASPGVTTLLPPPTPMAVGITSMPIGVMSIATPSRDSMTFTSTKGLLNGPGQNNCFLNSAVQVLWHLDIFRRSFRDLSGHACMADSCIFCALKELFSQLQFSTETALPPDALRRALAESFFDQQRFQLGFMDDAAECFENMLLRIHQHLAHGQAEDACAAPHCIPHQKFAMTLVEQSICGSCGVTSEPLSYTQMVHYVSTSTLVYQVRSNGRVTPGESFGKLLQKAGNMGDVRSCPSSCGSVIQISRSLMNHPEIVSVGLVWNSERPTLEHIMEVFSSIGTTLRLADIFNTVIDTRWAEISLHNLVGVVTYYGKHYSTFFFHTKLRVWIYFDDATVREVGPRWEQVVEKCKKGRYQPLLLLYALPDGTPVNTEYAPKQISPFFTEKTKKMPSQTTLRRSVTPSPEKPIIGNTRRAITPNPDTSSLNQKPPLPHGVRPYNEYQNLSVIQKNIYNTQENQNFDQVDGCLQRKEPEYVTRKCLDFNKSQVSVHRTLSNSSSSGVEMCIPEHLNIPRRRDSGNWSGDRNSASSSSSTTMENPYLYLVGKVPHGSVPGSPTRIKSDSSTSSGIYDAGYDSYSLSSNDSSSHSTLQHLMKMGHLAKIPEDYSNVNNNQMSQSCDVLCDEADELLVKSRQLEDEHDLVLALALCNAAATKARAAMNAPYNNPQTLTLARMKHNTCIMRARSLHRRMTQMQNPLNKDMNPVEIRHTREGSSGSGRHSRQNSRDKGNHSRQNSRELLVNEKDKQQMPSRQNSRELLVAEKEKPKPMKSIEIYATLPKKKDALKAKMNAIAIEDADYVIYDKPSRESRSIFSRNKNKDVEKVKEKRSRSEDRNKLSRGDFSIAPEIIHGKDTLKKAKEKEQEKEKDSKNKKQHKIRRKLLMGGLIKRKNRSMPDLTDAAEAEKTAPSSAVDDSTVGVKTNENSGMSGYLSEGHLEFAGTNANPNLERSKLMRKSFHGSAGKILTIAKVPPPPPLRTTSQLSTAKLNGLEVDESGHNRQYPNDHYQNHYQQESPMSLPYYQTINSSYEDDSCYEDSSKTVVTQAQVHQEQTPMKGSPTTSTDSGVDEVDCLPAHTNKMLELPPYPSPPGSAIHSRQASEEFPPPPPPLDLSALDEHLPKHLQSQQIEKPPQNSLLYQLQSKRLEIMSPDHSKLKQPVPLPPKSGGTWLRELQAKQAALRAKKTEERNLNGTDEVNTQRYVTGEAKIASVKDLACKFENTTKPQVTEVAKNIHNNVMNGVLSFKRREEDNSSSTIPPDQIAEELREVEMLTSAVNKVFSNHNNHEIVESSDENRKHKVAKKKSVSFCDQVILVATAEDQEDDAYIPNPILERVLRSAVNKPEAIAVKNEIMSLKEIEQRNREVTLRKEAPSPMSPTQEMPQQPLYVRRNSLDNLLHKSDPTSSQVYQTQANHNITLPPQVHYGPIPGNCNVPPSHQNCYSYATHSIQNNNNTLPQYNGNLPSDSNSIYSQQHQNKVQYGGQAPSVSPNQNYPYQKPLNQPHAKVNDPEYVRHGDIHQYKPVSLEPQYKTHQPPSGHQNIYQGHQTQQQYYSDGLVNNQNGSYVPNTHCNEPTPYRQSPYQLVPQNSAVYAQYYNNRPQNSTLSRTPPEYHPQMYRGQYNPPQVRQATPSPLGYPQNNPHQHSPSPAPSNVSSNYNYHPNMYRGALPQSNSNNINQGVYQRVPTSECPQSYEQYQSKPQSSTDMYQRVPPPHGEQEMGLQNGKYSPYMFPPKQSLKKSVSFEPGTKGCESPTPKAVVTPIVVNNANNSVPSDKTKCNLCRKKNVVAANLYCTDCEFYMSRFNPRS